MSCPLHCRFALGIVAFLALGVAQTADLETAWKLIGQGKRDEAVALLRRIVQSDSRNADAHLLLGSVLMEAGQRAESIAQLREAVQLLPRSAEARNALGEAYNAFGELAAARPEFERAVELDPAHAQAQFNLGNTLLQQNEPQAAIPHLEAAIRLFGARPEAAFAHYLRGKIYAEDNQPAQAASQFERAVELRPDLAEAWSDLGSARRSLSNDDGALTALRRAVALSPEDAVAQYRLGSLLLENGDARQAVDHLDAAVRLDPKNQSALNALQRALRQDGQAERADAVKAKLAALLRERDEADQKMVAAFELNNRGAELEKAGDLRGAVGNYRAALALAPEHAGIRTNLAVVLLKLGEWEEGIFQMRQALQRDPGDAKLQKALDDAIAQAKARGIAIGRR